jgi:hypothetical protein
MAPFESTFELIASFQGRWHTTADANTPTLSLWPPHLGRPCKTTPTMFIHTLIMMGVDSVAPICRRLARDPGVLLTGYPRSLRTRHHGFLLTGRLRFSLTSQPKFGVTNYPGLFLGHHPRWLFTEHPGCLLTADPQSLLTHGDRQPPAGSCRDLSRHEPAGG